MASSARIDELRKKFDENPRRYFAPLANEYRKAGDLEQAIFICQEYLPQQPGHMSGHIVYGQALFELSRFDESRQVFETALSLDPENLIALRHLGDIARQTGDSRSARTWYQRVLEADPRNEEIAQIMMSLLATPVASQMAIDPNMTPLGMPAVADPAVNGDSHASSDSSAGLGFQVEKSEGGSDLAVGPELSALPQRLTPLGSPPIPEATLKAHIPEDELLDLNDFDFSVGGVRLSELGASPSIDPAPAEPAHEAPESVDEEETFTGSPSAFVSDFVSGSALEQAVPEEPSAFDASPAADVFSSENDDAMIEKDEPPFEADPYAIAAVPMLPAEELSRDIDLELPDDTPPQTFGDSDAGAVLGLETFESGLGAPPAEAEAPTEFEAFFQATESGVPIENIFDVPSETPSNVEAIDLELPASEEPAFTDSAFAESSAAESSAAETSAAESAFAAPGFESLPELEPTEEDASAEEPIHDALDGARAEAPVVDESVPSAGAFAHFETPISSFQVQAEPLVDSVFELSLPVELPSEEAAAANEPVEAIADEPLIVEELSIEALPEIVDELPAAAHAEPAAEAQPAAAFVTETMAELYLQQGHHEAALEIYQQLVEQHPDDPQLRDRLRVLEDAVAGPTPVWSPALDAEAIAPEAPAGPTIREFLTSLVAWRPAAFDDATPISSPAVDEPAIEDMMGDDATVEEAASIEALSHMDLDVMGIDQPPPIDEEFGDVPVSDPYDVEDIQPYDGPIPSLLETSLELPVQRAPSFPASAPTPPSVPATPRPTPTHRGTPSMPAETVSGSIDALFSGADSSSGDANAASTLAQAFAPEGPDTTPLQGMPAHKASSELSLDHVFKTSQPPRPSGESEAFSFDQFFSDEIVEGGGKQAADDAAAPGGTGDDIAQFNNWLNGLKKT